jgi:hypothetical protein
MFAPGEGRAFRRRNEVVLGITANDGALSDDLANRSLPIHLRLIGDVANRVSAIGNPKTEFLPANRLGIEAELRGMIDKWRSTGCPLDQDVHHPFSKWAATIGGILKTSKIEGFLANLSTRRTADDPVRNRLGILGAARRGEWLTASDWARLVEKLGLLRILIPPADRETEESRARGIGRVLSGHQDVVFHVETEDERLVLKLEKCRRRFEGGEPSTRYRFRIVEATSVPADEADGPE